MVVLLDPFTDARRRCAEVALQASPVYLLDGRKGGGVKSWAWKEGRALWWSDRDLVHKPNQQEFHPRASWLHSPRLSSPWCSLPGVGGHTSTT